MNDKNFENFYFENTVNSIPEENYPSDYPLHWHKYIEIAAVLETDTENGQDKNGPRAEINQESYELEAGDILFFWPGELHRVTKNKTCKVIGIQFSAMFFNGLPDFVPYLNVFRSYHLFRAAELPELCQSIISSLQEILKNNNEGVPFDGVKSLISMYEIFINLAAHLEKTINKKLSPDRSSATVLKKITSVCTFLTENCDADISLETAAEYIGVSNSYFSRTFKKVTGYHFVEYLTLQRVRRAQMLLSDPGLSITDVCYQSGFKSSSSFNRAFLQYKGCSPSECRRYYLEK